VHDYRFSIDHRVDGADHAKPNAAEVSQVENVVKSGRSWQHLALGGVPQLPGQRNQTFRQLAHRLQ